MWKQKQMGFILVMWASFEPTSKKERNKSGSGHKVNRHQGFKRKRNKEDKDVADLSPEQVMWVISQIQSSQLCTVSNRLNKNTLTVRGEEKKSSVTCVCST